MPPVPGSRRRVRLARGRPAQGHPAAARLRAPARRLPVVVLPPIRVPRLRTLVAVGAIGLGVALMLASLAVAGAVERAVERTVETTMGSANFRVSAASGGTLSEGALVTVRSVLGVAVAAPAIEQRTTLVPEIDTAAPASAPVTVLGIDPVLDGQVHRLDLTAGTPLTRRDEAAAIITERLAAEDDYGLGSDVIVATAGEPERFRVIGIAAGDGPLAAAGGRTVILPIEAAQRMFGLKGVASVDLVVEDGIPLDGVRTELGQALSAEPHVLTTPVDLAASLRSAVGSFAGVVSGIAALGLVVGALLAFVAVRPAKDEPDGTIDGRSVRRTAALGAVGSVAGLLVGLLLGVLTTADSGPAAVGVPGISIAAAIGMLLAVTGRAWGRGRPGGGLETSAPVVGLAAIVAVAIAGAKAAGTAIASPGAPIVDRIATQLWALALLAALVAGLWVAGALLLHRARRGRIG